MGLTCWFDRANVAKERLRCLNVQRLLLAESKLMCWLKIDFWSHKRETGRVVIYLTCKLHQ